MGKLRGRGLQKFLPARRVEKQLFDLDSCPRCGTSLFNRLDVSPLDHHGRPCKSIMPGREHPKARNRGNTGQGLPAKPIGGNARKIAWMTDLAGGKSLAGQRGVGPAHPLAVIDHPNQGTPPVDNIDGDHRTSGIHAVIKQFFHDCRRTFDDLSGGDLRSHGLREDFDSGFNRFHAKRFVTESL